MKDLKIRFILFAGIFYFKVCECIHRRRHTDPVSSFENALCKAPYDAVIVPGFPHMKDRMTAVVQDRVVWACYLYTSGIAKNIIFSGSAVYSPYKEAEIMALYALQLGIPKEHVFTETQAEHSAENLYLSFKITEQKGFKRIAVATDVTQTSFMYNINSRRFKIPVDFIPIVKDILKSLPRLKPDIDQDAAFVTDFVSLIDREGFWQRFRGTRGYNVDKLMEEDRITADNR